MESVKIDKLIGKYGNNIVFKNLSVCFNSNKMHAIIGPNGSGKTTLIKYLIKELEDKNKSIVILNKYLSEYKQIELAKYQSLVPQMTKQDYEFTVRELVSLGRYCYNDIDTNNKVIDESLNLTDISEIQNKLITEISGGELQLAMLAKAICQETDIILLDEPTNNLDPKHFVLLMNILAKLKMQNKTIICVIHDLNAVLKYFDNAVLMNKGSVYAYGLVKEVITEKNIEKVFGVKTVISPPHDQFPSTIYYNL